MHRAPRCHETNLSPFDPGRPLIQSVELASLSRSGKHRSRNRLPAQYSTPLPTDSEKWIVMLSIHARGQKLLVVTLCRPSFEENEGRGRTAWQSVSGRRGRLSGSPRTAGRHTRLGRDTVPPVLGGHRPITQPPAGKR